MSRRTLLVCTLLCALPALAGGYERFPLPRTIPAEPGLMAVTPTHLWVTPRYSLYIARVGFDGQTQEIFPLSYYIDHLTGHPASSDAWFTSLSTFSKFTPAGVQTTRIIPPNTSQGVRAIAIGADGALWVALSGEIVRISQLSMSRLSQHSIPHEPNALVAGPDGNMWMTFPWANAIGRMTSSGTLTTFVQPSDGSGAPIEIAAGTDGKLWFTTANGRTRGISTSGTFTDAFIGGGSRGIAWGTDGRVWWHNATATLSKWVPGAASVESTYDLGDANVEVNAIAAAADGVWWGSKGKNLGRVTYAGLSEQWPFLLFGPWPYDLITVGDELWFTATNENQVGRMTLDGTTTLYDLPNENSQPGAITAGPDGAVWFTEWAGVGRIDPVTGTITELPFPESQLEYARDLAIGPDGNLWITVAHGDAILRLTPAGVYTVFPIPGESNLPLAIAAGADGNIWFTMSWNREIGRITPSGTITKFAAGVDGPAMAVGPDGQLWYYGEGSMYRMNTSGQRTFVGSMPELTHLIAGTDGAMWGRGLDRITRVTMDGTVHHFMLDFSGFGIANGPDDAIWVADGPRQALLRMNPDEPVIGTGRRLCFPANRHVQGVIASFVDPDTSRSANDYHVTIRWGEYDVQSSGIITQTAPGHFEVSGFNLYYTDGAKTATVALTALPSASRLGGTYMAQTTFTPPSLASGGEVQHAATGGAATLQVQGIAGCTWSASKQGSWIVFPNGGSGSGPGALQYTLQPNTSSSSRSGSITVGSVTVTITQSGGAGTGLHLVTPCRLFDSRAGNTPLAGAAERQIAAVNLCGIPADAASLVANITVVHPSQDGWLAAFASGTPWPGVSTMSYRPGRTRANNAMIPLGDGALTIRNGGSGPVHYIVDVTGYFR
jgi:virginiamycin B lyase